MPKGSKVLMADDDKMLLDMYKERLELAGYVVQSYYNGEDAIAHVHDFQPDIIMLDVMMPKMNGYETLASLKSDPTTKGIPVVMLSALMRDFNREKAVEGGAEDYLIKSEAMPSDVITKIEQVLQKFGKGSVSVPGAPAPSSQPTTPQPEPAAAPQNSPASAPVPSAPAPVAPMPPVPAPEAGFAPKLPVEGQGSSDLDQTKEPIMPDANPTGGSPDLGGKVFTTPSGDVQNSDLNKTEDDPTSTENSGDTLIFEPDQSEDKIDSGNSNPVPEPPKVEVAQVTEIAPTPVVTNTETNSVPESPVAEEVTLDEVAKTNWIVPVIVALIIILLVVGGITFYFAFMKK